MDDVVDGTPLYGTTATDEDGNVKLRGRIKNADGVRSLYNYLFQADLWNSWDRAMVQASIDDAPPYDTSVMIANARRYEANFNNGSMREAQFAAEAPYHEVLQSMEPLCSLPIKQSVKGNAQEKSDWSAIMAEEFTTLYKVTWTDFYQTWQYLIRLIVSQGVGFGYFDNDMDFRWKANGLQYFKTFRRVQMGMEHFDGFVAKDSLLAHQLYNYIRYPDEAKALGWNVDAVWRAIKNACPKSLSTNDYEQWQEAWKGNDLMLSATGNLADIIYCWIKEVDGTITLMIVSWDNGNPDFLYKREGRYDSWDQFLQIFTYGVGSDGFFHSIRGQGQALFPLADASSRLDCRMMDMSIFAATPHLKCANEDQVNDAPTIQNGPFDVIRPAFSYEETKVPDFEQSLLPAIGRMDSLMAARRSQWSAPVSEQNLSDQGKTPKTKYQLMQEGATSGAMSTAGFTLFMPVLERLLRESVRRATNPHYQTSDPGGREAIKFKNKCMARGVPKEAFYGIELDEIRVNTGIGKGSAQDMLYRLEEADARLYNRADPEGQYALSQKMAISILGPSFGMEVFPRKPGMRPPIDLQIAKIENVELQHGGQIDPTINQDHAVHIETHLTALDIINQQYSASQLDLATAAQQMQPIQVHTMAHMQMWASQGGEQDPRFPQYKEAVEQLSEVIDNGMKHIMKLQQEQGGGQQGPPGSPAGEPSPVGAIEQSADAMGRLQDLHFQDASNQQALQKAQADIEARKASNAYSQARESATLQHTILMNQEKLRAHQALNEAKIKAAREKSSNGNGSSK